MGLHLAVDPRSGYPIYLQIVEQIARAVSIGTLRPGDRLPTVKQLAAELVINPNTVGRALRELEHRGIVASLAGRGSFVSENGGGAAAEAAASDALAASLDAAVREARSLGIPEAAVHDTFSRALRKWYTA